MGLDLQFLCNGEWELTDVSLTLEQHHALMTLATSRGLPLLQRLSDYHEDAEFAPAELDALLAELEVLRSSGTTAAHRDLVVAMAAVVQRAKACGATLMAGAD